MLDSRSPSARAKGGVFVPLIVLAELSCVLRRKWEREKVLNAIDNLLHTKGVVVESPALVLNAIESSRIGPVGFANHLIAQQSFACGASEVVTFDKSFGRIPQIHRLT